MVDAEALLEVVLHVVMDAAGSCVVVRIKVPLIFDAWIGWI